MLKQTTELNAFGNESKQSTEAIDATGDIANLVIERKERLSGLLATYTKGR